MSVTDVPAAPYLVGTPALSVLEGAGIGSLVGNVQFADDDGDGVSSVRVLGDYSSDFELLQAGGSGSSQAWAMRNLRVFSGSLPALLPLVLRVEDDSASRQVAFVNVTVTLVPVNEAPYRVGVSNASAPVLGNIYENAPPGTLALDIETADPNAGEWGLLRLQEPSMTFSISSVSSGLWRLTNLIALDAEAAPAHVLGVELVDTGSPGAGAVVARFNIIVQVVNVNEGPAFVGLAPFSVLESAPVGTALGSVMAVDPENDTVTLIAAPVVAPFVLQLVSHNSWQLMTTAELDFESTAAYTLTLLGQDNGSPPVAISQAVTVSVLDTAEPAPSASATSSPAVQPVSAASASPTRSPAILASPSASPSLGSTPSPTATPSVTPIAAMVVTTDDQVFQRVTAAVQVGRPEGGGGSTVILGDGSAPLTGREPFLLRADGSSALMADIVTGTASSNPRQFTLLDARTACFTADEASGPSLHCFAPEHGVWKVADLGSTSTRRLRSLQAADAATHILAASGEGLYVVADTGNGTELHFVPITGGQAAGLVQVADVVPGAGSSHPTHADVYRSSTGAESVYFAASSGGSSGLYVARPGSTTGTWTVAPVSDAVPSYATATDVHGVFVVGSAVLFLFTDGAGTALAVAHDTEAGTSTVLRGALTEASPMGSPRAAVKRAGSEVLFAWRSEALALEDSLWVFDPTAEPVLRMASLTPRPHGGEFSAAWSVQSMAVANGDVFALVASTDGTASSIFTFTADEEWVPLHAVTVSANREVGRRPQRLSSAGQYAIFYTAFHPDTPGARVPFIFDAELAAQAAALVPSPSPSPGSSPPPTAGVVLPPGAEEETPGTLIAGIALICLVVLVLCCCCFYHCGCLDSIRCVREHRAKRNRKFARTLPPSHEDPKSPKGSRATIGAPRPSSRAQSLDQYRASKTGPSRGGKAAPSGQHKQSPRALHRNPIGSGRRQAAVAGMPKRSPSSRSSRSFQVAQGEPATKPAQLQTAKRGTHEGPDPFEGTATSGKGTSSPSAGKAPRAASSGHSSSPVTVVHAVPPQREHSPAPQQDIQERSTAPQHHFASSTAKPAPKPLAKAQPGPIISSARVSRSPPPAPKPKAQDSARTPPPRTHTAASPILAQQPGTLRRSSSGSALSPPQPLQRRASSPHLPRQRSTPVKVTPSVEEEADVPVLVRFPSSNSIGSSKGRAASPAAQRRASPAQSRQPTAQAPLAGLIKPATKRASHSQQDPDGSRPHAGKSDAQASPAHLPSSTQPQATGKEPPVPERAGLTPSRRFSQLNQHDLKSSSPGTQPAFVPHAVQAAESTSSSSDDSDVDDMDEWGQPKRRPGTGSLRRSRSSGHLAPAPLSPPRRQVPSPAAATSSKASEADSSGSKAQPQPKPKAQSQPQPKPQQHRSPLASAGKGANPASDSVLQRQERAKPSLTPPPARVAPPPLHQAPPPRSSPSEGGGVQDRPPAPQPEQATTAVRRPRRQTPPRPPRLAAVPARKTPPPAQSHQARKEGNPLPPPQQQQDQQPKEKEKQQQKDETFESVGSPPPRRAAALPAGAVRVSLPDTSVAPEPPARKPEHKPQKDSAGKADTPAAHEPAALASPVSTARPKVSSPLKADSESLPAPVPKAAAPAAQPTQVSRPADSPSASAGGGDGEPSVGDRLLRAFSQGKRSVKRFTVPLPKPSDGAPPPAKPATDTSGVVGGGGGTGKGPASSPTAPHPGLFRGASAQLVVGQSPSRSRSRSRTPTRR